jgi:hypothetical protein
MTATTSRHFTAANTRKRLVGVIAATAISLAFVTATEAADTAPVRSAQHTTVAASGGLHRVTSAIPAYATTLHAER